MSSNEAPYFFPSQMLTEFSILQLCSKIPGNQWFSRSMKLVLKNPPLSLPTAFKFPTHATWWASSCGGRRHDEQKVTADQGQELFQTLDDIIPDANAPVLEPILSSEDSHSNDFLSDNDLGKIKE